MSNGNEASIKTKTMKNIINTIKNNDSTTNTGLAIVTLIVLPLLITIVTNIDVNRLF